MFNNLSKCLIPISKVFVMPDTYKKEEKEPDYFFYPVSVQEKKGTFKSKQEMPLNQIGGG